MDITQPLPGSSLFASGILTGHSKLQKSVLCHLFKKIPRDLRLSGIWSRSHVYMGDRPFDKYNFENPTFEMRAFLAASGGAHLSMSAFPPEPLVPCYLGAGSGVCNLGLRVKG